ncbi:hypothetical protein [Tenacibaculum agarivorans]|uniref:hypothetical protein n=1 Tax=Tenacibaculum agarivorans TaxID=1908389 RepID=UPI00094B8A79|nr:hypothetical protein [Tenacibaculum agarivorans]
MKYTLYRKNNPDKIGIAKDLALLVLGAASAGLDGVLDIGVIGSFQKRDVLYVLKDNSNTTVYSNHKGEEYFLPETGYNLKYTKIHEIKKFGYYELLVNVINTIDNKTIATCTKKTTLNFFKGIQFLYQTNGSTYKIQLPKLFSKTYSYKIKKRVNYILFKKWKEIVTFKKIKDEEYTSVLELNFHKNTKDPFLLCVFFIQFMITEGEDGFWENELED